MGQKGVVMLSCFEDAFVRNFIMSYFAASSFGCSQEHQYSLLWMVCSGSSQSARRHLTSFFEATYCF